MSNYKEALENLNYKQRAAVETIEGPVMVIAGPGTGKTQTLALRIASILEKTQTNPQNILCLTFTDNASKEMLERLKVFIGAEAYKVKISTFHGFCDFLILENLEKFPRLSETSKALDEIEKLEIFIKIFSQLDINNPYRNIKKEDVYLADVIQSISKLKREGISTEDFVNIIKAEDAYFQKTKDIYKRFLDVRSNKIVQTDVDALLNGLEAVESDSIYFKGVVEYVKEYGLDNRNALKGGINKIYKTLSKDNYFPRLKSLAGIYKDYQDELSNSGKYDFDDMIIFVRDRLYSDENFLAEVREQFHYILVDEYQDTNNSQNEVIDLISNFDDNPNLFVVGDDDQSIFRFQGANLENIITFYAKYKSNLKLITLTENYRSVDTIVKASSQVIKTAENRLEDVFEKVDKNLKSHRGESKEKINITSYLNSQIEAEDISKQIKELLKTVPPSEIAVILTKNADIDFYAQTLLKNGISYNLSKVTATLEDDIVRNFILLLNYLINPTDEYLLVRVLYLDFWDYDNLDLFKLINYAKTSNINVPKLLTNIELLTEAKISKAGLEKFTTFINQLSRWQKLIVSKTPILSFKEILNDSGILNTLLQSDSNFSSVNSLYKVFQFIKSEDEKDEFVRIDRILEKIELARKYSLNLFEKNLLNDEGSINILTVHGAKGMEFQHVFMPLLKRANWEGSRDRLKTKLPQSINKMDYVGANFDDKIRLFYVAMTRAKDNLYLSFPEKDDNGKDTMETMFVSEIGDEYKNFVKHATNKPKLKNLLLDELNINNSFTPTGKDYVTDILKNFVLSPTTFNSYRLCPHCFFLKNVVKIPEYMDESASYGSAIHESIAHFQNKFKRTRKLPDENYLTSNFSEVLRKKLVDKDKFKEFEQFGKNSLKIFYENKVEKLKSTSLSEVNFSPYKIKIDDVPVKGKIDRIDFVVDGQDEISVIDYKTGKHNSSKVSAQNKGDYYTQLLFYTLLVKNHPKYNWRVKNLELCYIDPDGEGKMQKDIRIEISDDDLKWMQAEIKEVYNSIMSLDFDRINEKECFNKELHTINFKF